MSLYELAAELREVEELIEAAEAEGAQAAPALLSETIDCIEMDIAAKVDSVVRYIENEGAREAALAEEIKTLQAKKKTAEKRQQWLREYLRDFLLNTGRDNFETRIRKVSLKKPVKSLNVDLSKLSEWDEKLYATAVKIGAVEEKREVKKTLLKAMPDYLSLPGVEEVEGEYSIIIR